jgi:hypothetical protein
MIIFVLWQRFIIAGDTRQYVPRKLFTIYRTRIIGCHNIEWRNVVRHKLRTLEHKDIYVNISSVVLTGILKIFCRLWLKRHDIQRLDISPSSGGKWKSVTHAYENKFGMWL